MCVCGYGVCGVCVVRGVCVVVVCVWLWCVCGCGVCVCVCSVWWVIVYNTR